MKKNSAAVSVWVSARRANLPQTAGIAIVLSGALGLLLTNTTDELVAYLLVTAACGIPIAIWIQSGARGVPVMSALSAISFIYYALPILRKTLFFEPSDVLSAAFTVAIFLGTATLSWWLLIARSSIRAQSSSPELISGPQLERIMFCGLALGILYHLALYTGLLSLLGPALGLARSACLATAMAACFLLGHVRAQRSLRGQKFVLAVVCLGALVVMSWATLFLVTGIIFFLASVLGYVITSKRLPWMLLSASMVAIIVLHAGKDKMREKYWLKGTDYSALSLTEIPSLMTEWVDGGIVRIGARGFNSSGGSYSSAIDRASLLQLLIRVQRLTPDYVPFLEGKSYEILPYMLVPRFLFPDKITSQEAMKMLNIRFGFQTAEGAQKTAVGWGLIAEAYANFGRLGVVAVGLALGLLCGALERWSANAPLTSLPSLVAVVSMMQLLNLELDAAAIVTTLFQVFVAIPVMFWTLRAISKDQKSIPKRAIQTG